MSLDKLNSYPFSEHLVMFRRKGENQGEKNPASSLLINLYDCDSFQTLFFFQLEDTVDQFFSGKNQSMEDELDNLKRTLHAREKEVDFFTSLFYKLAFILLYLVYMRFIFRYIQFQISMFNLISTMKNVSPAHAYASFGYSNFVKLQSSLLMTTSLRPSISYSPNLTVFVFVSWRNLNG